MVFDKEHGPADEYYNYKSDDVGFTHLVGLDAICYYVSFKKVDKIFNGDHKLVRFRKLLNEYDLAAEGRPSFKCVIKGRLLSVSLKKLQVDWTITLNLLFILRRKNIKFLF